MDSVHIPNQDRDFVSHVTDDLTNLSQAICQRKLKLLSQVGGQMTFKIFSMHIGYRGIASMQVLSSNPVDGISTLTNRKKHSVSDLSDAINGTEDVLSALLVHRNGGLQNDKDVSFILSLAKLLHKPEPTPLALKWAKIIQQVQVPHHHHSTSTIEEVPALGESVIDMNFDG